VRTRTAHDNATPAGNGTLAGVLARLYYLTGKDGYRTRAEAVGSAFSGELSRYFSSFASLINASELLRGAVQLVVIGANDDPATRALARAAYDPSLPMLVLQRIAPEESLPEGHPAAGKGMKDGRPTAYVCRGATCSLPISSADELSRALAP